MSFKEEALYWGRLVIVVPLVLLFLVGFVGGVDMAVFGPSSNPRAEAANDKPFEIMRTVPGRIVSNEETAFFSGTSLVRVKLEGDIGTERTLPAIVSPAIKPHNGMEVLCRDVQMFTAIDGKLYKGGLGITAAIFCDDANKY